MTAIYNQHKVGELTFDEHLMHKVYYQNTGSNKVHTVLFDCRMEAETFKRYLKKTGECSFVSLNNSSWVVLIEE